MLNARRAFDSNVIKQPLRVALYSRYSGKNQNPLSAQEQQGRAIKKFKNRQVQFLKYTSEKYDYDLATFLYFKDEAKSGTKTGRDGYDAFKKCIENGDCDVAIVDDLSRIVRDLGEQMDFFYLLKFTGVELYSVGDEISSESPTSKVNFQIKGLVNEMERENIGLKTRRGLEARADKGLSCGDICFGFISVPTETRNRGGLIIPSHFKPEIELEQARTVNFIYDEYLKGVGLSAIAKQLNKNLIPSPTRGQKITGKKYNWNCSTIRKILTNPKYIGQWDWGRTKSLFNPITDKKVKRDVPKDQWVNRAYREDLVIISKDKWDRVQKRFTAAAVKYC
jgi:DNA invertase Pin-like site-specific DNA recombinase